jgi:hypothetical protein
MEATLLALALLGSPAVIPVSDRVPQFNVEALCQQTNCMRDEKDAQQQLVTLWSTNPSGVRDRCEGEAVAAGAPSYVDLLTCLQMTDLVNSQSTGAPLKGGSKNRNKK